MGEKDKNLSDEPSNADIESPLSPDDTPALSEEEIAIGGIAKNVEINQEQSAEVQNIEGNPKEVAVEGVKKVTRERIAIRKMTPEQFNTYIDRKIELRESREPSRLKRFDTIVTQSIWKYREVNRYVAAEAYMKWMKSITPDTEAVEITDKNSEFVKSVLPTFLKTTDYDQLGEILRSELQEGAVNLETIIEKEDYEDTFIADAPPVVVEAMVADYMRTGHIKTTQSGKIKLSKQGKQEGLPLNYAAIENADFMFDLLNEEFHTPAATLRELYAASNKATEIKKIEIKTKNTSSKVLHLTELLIGNKNADINFFEEVVETIKSMPKEDQPDAIVLSGIVQGDFKFWEKPRKTTLVPELNSMDKQFKHAKEMIDKITESGIPLIYNMSNDDRRIAREYTVEVFRKMFDMAGSQDGVAYWQMDKMEQHPAWIAHLKFQNDVVMPYCLKSGRRLRTASEMYDESNGEVTLEEYFVLFDVYRALAASGEINPIYRELLDIDNIILPDQPNEGQDLIIAHDFDFKITGKNTEYSQMIRHNMNFSTQPMYAGHMKTPMDTIAQMKIEGEAEGLDALVTEHNQEMMGVKMHDTWVISTPGFIDAKRFMESTALTTDAQGDISRRLVTTRRRMSSPAATMHEFTADKRHILTVFNKKLMDKADSLPERTVLAFASDWQNGSSTARPDYQVKYMDFLNQKIIPNNPTYLFFGGDIIHGRNYPDFPSESEITSLMSMNSQERFVQMMIERALTSLNPEDLKNLMQVGVIPGNHEWNSGTTKWHGYTFSTYLRQIFENLYRENGIDPKVKQYEAIMTPKGDLFKSWTAVEKIGAYGVLNQHFALEKGGKGGMSSLPVTQAHGFFNGAGDLMKNIDLSVFHHWHHPQYTQVRNKLAVVTGSLAGQSQYEFLRGYRAEIGVSLLHIGGGKPVQADFISEETLQNHTIKEGFWSDKFLKEEFGIKNHQDFDPKRHGIYMMEGYPKSALQQGILRMRGEVAGKADSTSMLGV
jgi:hypothetical protein